MPHMLHGSGNKMHVHTGESTHALCACARYACPPIYCYGPVSPALPTGCSVRPLGALVLFSSGPAPRPTHWGPPSWQPRGLPNRTGPTLGAAVPKQGLESGTKNRREGVSTDSILMNDTHYMSIAYSEISFLIRGSSKERRTFTNIFNLQLKRIFDI